MDVAKAKRVASAEESMQRETYCFKYVGTADEARLSLLAAPAMAEVGAAAPAMAEAAEAEEAAEEAVAAGAAVAMEAAEVLPARAPNPPKGIGAFFHRAVPAGGSSGSTVGTPAVAAPPTKSPLTHGSSPACRTATAAPTPLCLTPQLPTTSRTPSEGVPSSSASGSKPQSAITKAKAKASGRKVRGGSSLS